jgi:hypothetical protein
MEDGTHERIKIQVANQISKLRSELYEKLRGREFDIVCGRKRLNLFLCSLSPKQLENLRIELRTHFLRFRIGGAILPPFHVLVSSGIEEWKILLQQHLSVPGSVRFKFSESKELPNIVTVQNPVFDVESEGKIEVIVPICELLDGKELISKFSVPLTWSVLDFINGYPIYDFQLYNDDLRQIGETRPIYEVVFRMEQDVRIKRIPRTRGIPTSGPILLLVCLA